MSTSLSLIPANKLISVSLLRSSQGMRAGLGHPLGIPKWEVDASPLFLWTEGSILALLVVNLFLFFKTA